jgi:hypothetical protein
MGKGWKKSNSNRATGGKVTLDSVVSKKVLWVSLETSFNAFAVIDTGADHLQESVFGEIWVARVIESLGKSPGQVDALIELADGKQSGITGELARRWLDHE